MVANYNPYFIVPMITGDKMVQAVGLAIEMAKQSYPHLVEEGCSILYRIREDPSLSSPSI